MAFTTVSYLERVLGESLPPQNLTLSHQFGPQETAVVRSGLQLIKVEN